MTAYALLKLLHQVTVVASISLFVYRYSLLTRFPQRPLPRYLKVLPHVNDTVLLAAAIGMLVTLHLNPFAMPWLTAKIVALLVYIVLGGLCLRAPPRSARQAGLFVAAVVCFSYIVWVALRKQWLPF